MTWTVLQNSVLLALGVATLTLLLGTVCATWTQSVSRQYAFAVTASAAIALALPPFLVANTWMHFFGLNGVWRSIFNFNLYSWPGAVVLMTLLFWPVTFFLVRASLSRLETERMEADPLLKG